MLYSILDRKTKSFATLNLKPERRPGVEEQKPFEFKPWMLVALLVASLLILLNFDPIGDRLEKILGQGADRWTINVILIALIIYTFIKKK
jgi:hypothetical protein